MTLSLPQHIAYRLQQMSGPERVAVANMLIDNLTITSQHQFQVMVERRLNNQLEDVEREDW